MRYTSEGAPGPRHFYCNLQALIIEKKIIYMKKTEKEKQRKKLTRNNR